MNRFLDAGAAFVAAFVFFGGCTWAHAGALPAWVSVLPEKPGHMYALGTANITEAGSEAKAIASAAEQAKIELLSSLRASVKSTQQSQSSMQLQKNDTASAFAYEQQVQKITQITARARDLPGLGVAETFVDRATSSVYALAHLDLSAAATEIGRRQQQMEERLARLKAMEDLPLDELGSAESFLRAMEPTVDMAALFASRIGSKQSGKIQSMRDEYRSALMRMKKKVTFGFDEKAAAGRDVGALMSAVTNAGYSWSQAPRYTFAVQGDRDRKYDFAYDRHVVKATMNLLLVDSDGTVVRAAQISASGNGNTKERAEAQINKRFDEEIHTTTENWLAGLATNADAASMSGEESDDTTAANANSGSVTPGSSAEPVSWGRR